MRDRTHLLALSEHFKHVSTAMTSQGYVGTDFELNALVDEQGRATTAIALDQLLSSDQLAGRMGDRIRTSGAVFRGRAGEQARTDYIKFVMRETDLRIYACDYGWCVFQPEAARCGGQQAPNDAQRSPAICLSCTNMVIEPKHATYWQDRRDRNMQLLPIASLLAKASLNEAIAQCDKVLMELEKKGRQDEARRSAKDRPKPDDQAARSSTRYPGGRATRTAGSRRSRRGHT